MLRNKIAILGLLFFASISAADITAKNHEYKHGSKTLEAVFVYDSSSAGQRPGVLLVSELGATAPDVRVRAGHLAKQGYGVLCVDLYGKGVVPTSSRDAASKLDLETKDLTLARGRVESAIDLVGKIPQIDSKRLVGIGYGHGATIVWEATRYGADFEGVVCVHGNILQPIRESKKLNTSLLIIVDPDESRSAKSILRAFEDDLKTLGVDWKIIHQATGFCEFPPARNGKDPKSFKSTELANQKINEAINSFLADELPVGKKPAIPDAKTPNVAKGVPDKALKVLAYVDKNGEAMSGYEGGRTFGNFEKRLPQSDEKGRRIKYREWDVNPLRPGVNRGAERLVTGSDGSAHYTSDHYETFKKIR